MEQLGKLIDCNGKRIYLVKGIFDYFDDKNFPRLLKAWEEAKELGAQLYVGLYTDDVLERTGHKRRLKGKGYRYYEKPRVFAQRVKEYFQDTN